MSGNSKSGRKPLPTTLKLLTGNPGKRPLNTREPQPKGGLPECPAHLEGKARDAWQQFAAGLAGIATSLDAAALELLAAAYARHIEALAQVAQDGPVWIEATEPGKLPNFRISPYWKIAQAAWKQVHEMLSEFGMTPSSRTRLKVPTDDAGDEFDHFTAPRSA